MVRRTEDQKFQQDLIATQKAILKILRTYSLSVVWLTALMTAWFVLWVSGVDVL